MCLYLNAFDKPHALTEVTIISFLLHILWDAHLPAIAKESGFDEEDVLAELFYGTLVGLVAMR